MWWGHWHRMQNAIFQQLQKVKKHRWQLCYAKKLKMHAVSMTPHARCMRWHWCQMNDAFGVIDTTWTVHAVSLTPHAKYDTVCTIAERFGRSWQTWKGISIKMFANWPTPPIQKYINLRGLLNKKKFVHAVSWKWAIKKSNIFANWKQNTKALAYELGAQVALFDEKKPKIENLVTLSL
jgi:hypothetical protein